MIVFKRGVSPVRLESGKACAGFAIAAYGNGATGGLAITSTGISVSQSEADSDGVKIDLNENGAQYTIIAFK